MSENPFLTVDRRLLGDIYTSREAVDNLAVMCDDFGSRFGGTPGEEQAMNFLRDRLAQYGLQRCRAEEVPYMGWRRGQVQCEILEPVAHTLAAITLPHSPPADLTGPLLDLGDGAPAAFEEQAAAIPGHIVMVSSEVRPGSERRWIHRNEKYGRALLAGAVGFVFVNHYPAYGPATGGIGPDSPRGGAALIPGVALSQEDGAYLQRLLQRHGQVRVRIRSTDQVEPMISWNVLADLPGTAAEPEAGVIMLGCHYDGHDISQGAEDPASGAVALLEAARVLARHAGRHRRTIQIAFWGVEELGLIGSTQFVQNHAGELDRIRFYLNMDAAGAIPADQKGIVLNEWPQLAPLFRRWGEEMAQPIQVKQSLNAHSDHYPFLLAGVPTGSIGNTGRGRGGRGYGHTRYDTLDKVRPINLREAAALAARLALRLANQEPWPATRRSPVDVAAVLDRPHYRAERSLFDQVAAHYAAALPPE